MEHGYASSAGALAGRESPGLRLLLVVIAGALACLGVAFFDPEILRATNSLVGRWTALDQAVDWLDQGRLLWVFLMALCAEGLRRAKGPEARARFFLLVVAASVTFLMSGLLGRVVSAILPVRPRPPLVLDGIRYTFGEAASLARAHLLAGRPGSSFPSSHAILGSSVGLALLWFRTRRAAWIALLGTALMVFPVLATAVHWPSDVAGGILIAALCAAAVYSCRSWLARPAAALQAVAERWPACTTVAALLFGALLVWRAGPHTGVLGAISDLVRRSLHPATG